MRIRKLNFNKAPFFVDTDECLIFVKPLGSRLHRVFKIPDFLESKRTEVQQVLNTLCLRCHKRVWYFNFRDPDLYQDIMATLTLMDANPILISLDNVPDYSN